MRAQAMLQVVSGTGALIFVEECTFLYKKVVYLYLRNGPQAG